MAKEKEMEEFMEEAEEPVIPEEEPVTGDVEEPENAEEEASEDAADSPDEGKRPAFFKKRENKKIAELEEQNAAITDRFQRLMAEFDNFRKRTTQEKSSMYDSGVVKTVEKLLPVLDSFERGLLSVPEENREDPIYEGMDKIYRQLTTILTDMGVEEVDARGKEFDPNLHNAVLQVENDELESNTVSQELQKGYTYKGILIRPSMVAVVK